MREFTVEASVGANRIIVRWDDPDSEYHFMAKVTDDRITEVQSSTFHRFPTIFKRTKAGGRGSTSYKDARDSEFAPIVEAAIQAVYLGGLATKAIERAATERAENERLRMVAKATAIRTILLDIDLQGVPTDEKLAEAYDRIQNSAA